MHLRAPLAAVALTAAVGLTPGVTAATASFEGGRSATLRIPGALVGRWFSAGGGDARYLLILRANGTYQYAALAVFDTGAGTVEVGFEEHGRATVRGASLVLRRQIRHQYRIDEASPDESYDRTLGPRTVRHGWSLRDGVLRVSEKGVRIAYVRG